MLELKLLQAGGLTVPLIQLPFEVREQVGKFAAPLLHIELPPVVQVGGFVLPLIQFPKAVIEQVG